MQALKEIIEHLNGDPYQILNTSPQSDLAVLRKNYRTLAVKFHPDKNKEENAKLNFIKINEAYEFLESETNRNLYHAHHKLIQSQRKKTESMNEERRKRVEDLKRREEEFKMQGKDMERELARRKEYFNKKMKEEQEREELRAEVVQSMGSEKYYQMIQSFAVSWPEGLSFTSQMLRIAFSDYGKVVSVSPEPKRNRAAIMLNSIEDCTRLVQTFKHPLLKVSYQIQKSKRDRLQKALRVQKNATVDLSLNSDNIARIKEIVNRNSTLYHKNHMQIIED